jgi:hypothetical protein
VKKIISGILLVLICVSTAEAWDSKVNDSEVRWKILRKHIDNNVVRKKFKRLIKQEGSKEGLFAKAAAIEKDKDDEFYKQFNSNRIVDIRFYADGSPYKFTLLCFEGLGGPSLRKSYGLCREMFAFIDESTSEQITLTGICGDYCGYQMSLKCDGNFIDFNLIVNNKGLDENIYWFDNCFNFPKELFNPQSELYYFNPDPVRIEHIAEPDRHSFSIPCRKEVPPFWEGIKPAGNKNPAGVMLVYNRDKDLGIVISWDKAAMLGINFYSCVHVNPGFSSTRGRIGVLRGSLASMREYIAKNYY